MKKILLVEPSYETKYPPLGLMKISAYHKQMSDEVKYVKGLNEKLPLKDYDIVYITSLFTYEAKKTLEAVRYYKHNCTNADIVLGGVFFSLMPDYVQLETGIRPHSGLWTDVEFTPPDYSLIPSHKWANHSFVFTTRGCPNKCGFCAVKALEPKKLINNRWREHISPMLPYVMIHDNNITAADFEHYKEVVTYLATINKQVTFDNGFDCRLFTRKHCDLLSRVKMKTVRFAFDTMKHDGYVQKAIEMCVKTGIQASSIVVYVLFNYRDSLEDALYRAKEVAKLGAQPFAMRYTPLDAIEPNLYFYGSWNAELCADFSFFVNVLRFANLMTFEEWRAKWKKYAVRYKKIDDHGLYSKL